MTDRFDVDTLLAETGWLTGLARQLVSRRHEADDLVQETLRSAIESPPAANHPLRGWLRTVMISRWRDAHRSRRARDRREQQWLRGESAPSAGDVVAKAEVHGALVQAVLALEEPYRSCLLLRFFENLPPRAIARRLAVPVATVNSRLQRALARLRERFRQQQGSDWQLALMPLLSRSLRLSTFVLGVSLVNALAKLAMVAATVLIAMWVWPWSTAPEPVSAPPIVAASAPSAAAGVAATGEGVAESPQRVAVAPVLPPTAEPAVASPTRRLHGRVIDMDGVAIAGVNLVVHGARDDRAATVVRSEPGGAFECELQPGDDSIATADGRWATVLSGSARAEADRVVTVVVAPRVDLGGSVVDAAGNALAGAAVAVHMPAGLGAHLGILLDDSLPRTWRVPSDSQGRFALADVPVVTAATLSVSLGGYRTHFAPVPTATDDLLRFVLERPVGSATLLEGLVVDQWGAAVAGARVSAGADVALSDARGGFALDLSKAKTMPRLLAIAPGMQPAVFVPERDAADRPLWPPQIVMQLGGQLRSLRGRVVDGRGKSVPGAKVWIADPMLVGVEDDVVLAETALGRRDHPFWAFVLTDASGSFCIDGLSDRDYEVRALDPTTLVATSMTGVRAGREDVELRLDQELLPTLRGRVVARDGGPIAAVQVNLQRPALEVQVPGGTRDEWATGQAVRTDADGAFVLTQVPRTGVEVFASGDDILFAGRMLTPDVDPEHFVLQVERRVHLQVELAPPLDRGDRVRVLDKDGKAMLLRVMRGGSAYTSSSAEVHDGRSQILSLGEGATTAVLWRGDVEVARLPLHLQVGAVNSVRF